MSTVQYEASVTDLMLSVIIPMYNCGPVIIRCMDSLDYENMEIIVVDDGSTDNSANNVSVYQKSHSNVKLIQKSHIGVSSARNIGIEAARGKYLMFVDADDYLASGGICRVINIAENSNADIVKYLIDEVESGSTSESQHLSVFLIEQRTIEGQAAALKRYDISDYHVVDAIFKRSIIIDNHIRFDEDLHLREDDVFMGKFYCFTSKLVCTNLPLYKYVRSSQYSSTHHQTQERNRVLIDSCLLAIKYRSEFINTIFPNDCFPYEKFKYMRWVCNPRQAVEAGYSFGEYKRKLEDFHQLGVYPVRYQWIKIARWDYSVKIYLKNVIKTFLLNHPLISYPIAKLRFQ